MPTFSAMHLLVVVLLEHLQDHLQDLRAAVELRAADQFLVDGLAFALLNDLVEIGVLNGVFEHFEFRCCSSDGAPNGARNGNILPT